MKGRLEGSSINSTSQLTTAYWRFWLIPVGGRKWRHRIAALASLAGPSGEMSRLDPREEGSSLSGELDSKGDDLFWRKGTLHKSICLCIGMLLFDCKHVQHWYSSGNLLWDFN